MRIVRKILYIASCIDGPCENTIVTLNNDKFTRLYLPSSQSHYPYEYIKVGKPEEIAGGNFYYVVQPYSWIIDSGVK